MNGVLTLGGVATCLFVIGGVVCRLNEMRWGEHGPAWMLMYLAFGPFAGGVLVDLVTLREVDWYVCFAMGGIALHVFLTQPRWRYGAPPETTMGACE